MALLSASEAAEALGMSVDVVKKRARRHKIGRKVGRLSWAFTPKEVERIGAVKRNWGGARPGSGPKPKGGA